MARDKTELDEMVNWAGKLIAEWNLERDFASSAWHTQSPFLRVLSDTSAQSLTIRTTVKMSALILTLGIVGSKNTVDWTRKNTVDWTRMTEQGTDGLSLEELFKGVMVGDGESILFHVPPNKAPRRRTRSSARQRCETGS
jgi:hypothetical protein